MEGLLLAAAAIIVTFNSEAVIGPCLDALARMAPHVKPIVVDNASSDRTLNRVRERAHICVIPNPQNRGFAAAVNQGISACEEEYLLLLNPDANLLTGVDALIEASRQYGLAAGKLVDAQGSAQAGFTIRRLPTPISLIFELFGINRLWPSNPVNRRYRYLDRSLDQPGPVEQPAGAFLMTRRDTWKNLGGLDESFYPIWFEDVDFCKRALDSGVNIQYVPSVQAVHQGAHSVGRIPPGCRALYWCVSLTRYAAKHFRSTAYRVVCLSVVLSSIPRMVARMILDRGFQSVAVYSKIVRFAGLCLVSFGRSAARGSKEFHNF
ncbi:MAG TPA: glycosyltransferase family 2 protein [Bryobacteraceae bacterium]|nr:glycosyltransferase family 2 protein [Bryobacteraceae bacterium]